MSAKLAQPPVRGAPPSDRVRLAHHLGLAPDGTAVWMGSLNDVETVSGLTLRGDSLRFDQGPDLSDMALVGRRLYWMRGDESQTAEAP